MVMADFGKAERKSFMLSLADKVRNQTLAMQC